QVDVVDQVLAGGAGQVRRDDAGPGDDQGDGVHGGGRHAVVAVDAQLTELLAVVGGDDDRRLRQHPLRLQHAQHPADAIVQVAQAGVVAVDQAVEVGPGGDVV